MNDLRGKAVLITGGTKGIGLATGLAFAAQGAAVTLTNKWGSADEDDIRARFAELGAPEPMIVSADVREDEDTDDLLTLMKERHDSIEVFVSGAAFAQTVDGVDAYSRRGFVQSIEYSVWPTAEYPRRIKAAFGHYPRYVVALSSNGADSRLKNYDLVAACKSSLETLCRYMAARLIDEDVRVNVVRTLFVDTESFSATMGEDCAPFFRTLRPDLLIPLEDTAKAVLALASGMMDGVTGQTLMVDRGGEFSDNLMGLFEETPDLPSHRQGDRNDP